MSKYIFHNCLYSVVLLYFPILLSPFHMETGWLFFFSITFILVEVPLWFLPFVVCTGCICPCQPRDLVPLSALQPAAGQGCQGPFCPVLWLSSAPLGMGMLTGGCSLGCSVAAPAESWPWPHKCFFQHFPSLMAPNTAAI